jgi:hypothetical protein
VRCKRKALISSKKKGLALTSPVKIVGSGYVKGLKTLLNALCLGRFLYRFSAIFSIKTLSVFYIFSAESFCRVKMRFLNVKNPRRFLKCTLKVVFNFWGTLH